MTSNILMSSTLDKKMMYVKNLMMMKLIFIIIHQVESIGIIKDKIHSFMMVKNNRIQLREPLNKDFAIL